MTGTASSRGRRALGAILGVLVVAAATLEPRAAAARAQRHHGQGRLADLAPEAPESLQELPEDVARAGQEQDPECAADVAGESVMGARCRATCLEKFAAPSEGGLECASRSDACLACWDHCGELKRGGPETLASVCKDENLCWLGCRTACDFYFPYGLGSGPDGARWSLRPTKESSTAAPVRALPPPRFDADELTLRWRHPVHAASTTTTVTTTTTTSTTTTDSSTTTTSTMTPISAGEDGEALDATVEDVSREAAAAEDAEVDASAANQDAPSPTSQARPSHKHVVFIVSARMAPSLAWRELKQTVDNWLELSESQRSHMRAVSVLAVSTEGPVARAASCVSPLTAAQHHPEPTLEDADYYDEDNSSDEDDEHDEDAGSAAEATPDNSLRRLSFDQLRGTVQHGVLLRALLKDRTTAKHLVEDAAQEDEGDEDDDEDDEEDETVLLDRRRLELVKRLLGAGVGRGRGGRGRGGKAPAPAGWGLHLVGVWAAGGGARLPRARVAWTAPRGVAETLVNWAVPALRISGSRVVSGASHAEVPLVEQHATRVTVGDAHSSSDVSPALVLQLSVQTVSSATAGVEDGEVEAAAPAPAPAAPAPAAPALEQLTAPRASYEQAALWEATLVAVGLVVGAAALCVALFLAAYGVHSRVARCCRGRGHAGMSGIHSKSASVEPLNAPDQNNV